MSGLVRTRTGSRLGVALATLTAAAVFTRREATAQYELHTFEKQQLSDKFYCEGATFGDLDRDGKADVIAGPFWYSGPDFKVAHEIYPPAPFATSVYSDNFFAFVQDFDGDGWNDVLFVGFPGKEATWYRNPRGEARHWDKHVVFTGVDNESPTFTDLNGDGKPELVCQFQDRMGYALVDWSKPEAPWQWHPLSDQGIGGCFTHGLGVGDLDGDGRMDVLWKNGWWRQPESLAGDAQWEHHPVKFAGNGGAQMLVFDVDGDGDNDVVTSDNAHGYGLYWFEQRRQGAERQFVPHRIMGSQSKDNAYGVVIGNLHALCAADVNGDGLPDVITGNRYFAHGGKDRADGERPKIAWFELRRVDGIVSWAPHEIDGNSGVGTQVVAGDFTGDGRVDVVVGNKMGTFVHRHQVQSVSRNARRAAARAELLRMVGGGDRRRPGSLPKGADGRSLNFDFETGDLRDWQPDGEAFASVVDGDTVAARRDDMRSGHEGRYWIGSYEATRSDRPRGTLTSAQFVLDQPFASFLIAGGKASSTRVEIVRADSGEVVFKASGPNHEEMQPVNVDLSAQVGKSLFVRLVDDATGGWGHLNFDDFRLHATAAPVERKGGFPVDEAVKRMDLPEGFHVKAFAAEPEVRQPVAMALDERGRLWVAEAYAYPRRQPDGQGKDRILVFEDPDGDGHYDKRTVFTDKLNLVSGLEVGFGGVFVGAAPYLMFLPDRNDDLVPDGEPEILLDGWHYEDTHETLNTFTWGPDGWLYGCHGVFTHSRVGKPGTPDKERQPLDAAVWRFHPRTRQFEVFAHGTSNPWGIDFDEHGQAFITACVIPHLYHVIQGGVYTRQSGRHFNRYAYADLNTIADHLHYVGSTAHDGNNLSDAVGGGHAHCGAMLYRGGRWPEAYTGALFMDNIHGHRLNMDLLRRDGSGFAGSHGEDFLVANDACFMAVAFAYGHDGNVFLIDWYDVQSCHLTDPEVWDRSNGRIYKICYGDAVEPPVDLRSKSNAELVTWLFHRNEFYARRARRLLQERAAIDTAPALRQVLGSPERDEPQRLRALWALHCVGGLDDAQLDALLDDRAEYVRAFAIQLALEDRSATPRQLGRFAELAARDPSPAVRLYLASALQRLPEEQRWPIAEALARRAEDAQDRNLPLMVWFGIEPALAADPARALALARSTALPHLPGFVVRRLTEAGGAALEAVIAGVAAATSSSQALALLGPAQTALERHGEAAMPQSWPAAWDNVARLSDPRASELAAWLGAMFGDQKSRPALARVAADKSAPRAQRDRAFDLMVRIKAPDANRFARDFIDDPDLGERAIRALASFDDDGVPALLLGKWKDLGAGRQRAAIATLSSRAAWAMPMLDAVAAGTIEKSALDASTRQQLTKLANAGLEQRLTEVWGRSAAPSAATRDVIAGYKKKLTPESLGKADLPHGRATYARTCMACHKLFGTGMDIGPEITGGNRKDLDYILGNILDPNAEVARDYMTANVHLTAGGLATGLITDETETAVTVRAQAQTQVIARKDIARIERLELSLMPTGLLEGMSDDEVRDLIAYLGTDQQVPLRATQGNAALLFDGESLSLWDATAGVWSVEKGEIVGRTATGLKDNDFARSHLLLGDFELALEVKLAGDQGNSGVQFRSEALPKGGMRGYQADIGPGWWGKLYEEHGRELLVKTDGDGLVKKGDWNRYRILAEGTRIRTWINDQPCVDLDDPNGARSGIVGLQVHAGGPTEVRFRNLVLTVK